MPHDFEIGEIVQLRVGGPRMVVHDINGDDITCHFPTAKDIREKKFRAAELVRSVETVDFSKESLEALNATIAEGVMTLCVDLTGILDKVSVSGLEAFLQKLPEWKRQVEEELGSRKAPSPK